MSENGNVVDFESYLKRASLRVLSEYGTRDIDLYDLGVGTGSGVDRVDGLLDDRPIDCPQLFDSDTDFYVPTSAGDALDALETWFDAVEWQEEIKDRGAGDVTVAVPNIQDFPTSDLLRELKRRGEDEAMASMLKDAAIVSEASSRGLEILVDHACEPTLVGCSRDHLDEHQCLCEERHFSFLEPNQLNPVTKGWSQQFMPYLGMKDGKLCLLVDKSKGPVMLAEFNWENDDAFQWISLVQIKSNTSVSSIKS